MKKDILISVNILLDVYSGSLNNGKICKLLFFFVSLNDIKKLIERISSIYSYHKQIDMI